MNSHKPARSWARNGLSRIKNVRKADELHMQHTGFTEFEQDPRKQMSWDNFFAKFHGRHHDKDDELHLDGGIKPFAPFA
jgi:hypothetical protein